MRQGSRTTILFIEMTHFLVSTNYPGGLASGTCYPWDLIFPIRRFVVSIRNVFHRGSTGAGIRSPTSVGVARSAVHYYTLELVFCVV